MYAADQRPVTALFSDAVAQLSKLIGTELALARAEMGDKASRAMSAATLLAVAALFTMPAIVLLLMALAAWLQELGLTEPVSDLIAGVVGLVIAGLLGAIGIGHLKANSLVPERTLHQLRMDAAVAKEHV
jgi:uncharacterized membrane protein YqjE